MGIFDKSLLRPEVREVLERLAKNGNKVLKKQLLKRFYKIPRLMKLQKKVVVENQRVMEGRITDFEELKSIAEYDEILFMVKFFRERQLRISRKGGQSHSEFGS